MYQYQYQFWPAWQWQYQYWPYQSILIADKSGGATAVATVLSNHSL
jgi:hypothetical protein